MIIYYSILLLLSLCCLLIYLIILCDLHFSVKLSRRMVNLERAESTPLSFFKVQAFMGGGATRNHRKDLSC